MNMGKRTHIYMFYVKYKYEEKYKKLDELIVQLNKY